ncbi:hypothetical protein WD019_11595 [Fictibacillus sp. Mic-4]|uniref:hypothetical protein n=1 Tax=Fictibacillus sp. Mic-4 TaxID=3132826 RepID=UPI003CF9F0B5
MNTGKLDIDTVKKIVEEVVRRLLSEEKEAYSKPRLLIIDDESKGGAGLETVIEKCRPYWNISVAASTQEEEITNEFSHVIFLNSDQDFIVRGAIGLTDTYKSKLLARVLHLNIPATLVLSEKEEWAWGSETTSAYKQYLENQRKRLETFGAFVTTLEQLDGALSKAAFTGKPENIVVYHEKLLTESKINHIHSEKVLLNKATIVTPLAKDAARKKGIQLCFEDSGR